MHLFKYLFFFFFLLLFPSLFQVLEEVGADDTAVMGLTAVGEVDHNDHKEQDQNQGNASAPGLGLGLTNGGTEDGSGGAGRVN